MTNDTNITNDKDINANIAHDDHFNDSIVNEVILEDMKKNRIDHMKYLPDMDTTESAIHSVNLTGTDDKKAGEPEEDSCKVRIIFAVYSEDGQDGPLALLNLILRVRSELKKAGTIGGGQFALELPLEYIVYQDTTPPYYMGEMVTNWSMPVTQRLIQHPESTRCRL